MGAIMDTHDAAVGIVHKGAPEEARPLLIASGVLQKWVADWRWRRKSLTLVNSR